ncbi:MAG: sulfotransferase family 2 domain-containing protein [Deltaproteobacteria bacterium]|nr:sulfotransferase family 2 domain-containing protein [Deltaproteobacteria bacterium]
MSLTTNTLIFVHIPKSAGTTLSRIIDWEYDPRRIYSVIGRYFRWSYNRLLRLPQRRLSQIQVFKGHMPFGLHQHLKRPAIYLTVLRNPVDRAISDYCFSANGRLHPDHRQVKNLTLREFIDTTPYNNIQTKLLAGQIPGYDFLAGECTPEMFTAATENLRNHFALVGLTERFEESLALAKVLFGWSVRRYVSFRVTRGRPSEESIPPATRSLIAERNAFDVALYDQAVGLFEELAARNREDIADAVRALRHAREIGATESLFYRCTSAVLKAFTNVNSAVGIC